MNELVIFTLTKDVETTSAAENLRNTIEDQGVNVRLFPNLLSRANAHNWVRDIQGCNIPTESRIAIILGGANVSIHDIYDVMLHSQLPNRVKFFSTLESLGERESQISFAQNLAELMEKVQIFATSRGSQ